MTYSWFSEDSIFEQIAEETENEGQSETPEFDDAAEGSYDLDYTVQY